MKTKPIGSKLITVSLLLKYLEDRANSLPSDTASRGPYYSLISDIKQAVKGLERYRKSLIKNIK